MDQINTGLPPSKWVQHTTDSDFILDLNQSRSVSEIEERMAIASSSAEELGKGEGTRAHTSVFLRTVLHKEDGGVEVLDITPGYRWSPTAKTEEMNIVDGDPVLGTSILMNMINGYLYYIQTNSEIQEQASRGNIKSEMVPYISVDIKAKPPKISKGPLEPTLQIMELKALASPNGQQETLGAIRKFSKDR